MSLCLLRGFESDDDDNLAKGSYYHTSTTLAH